MRGAPWRRVGVVAFPALATHALPAPCPHRVRALPGRAAGRCLRGDMLHSLPPSGTADDCRTSRPCSAVCRPRVCCTHRRAGLARAPASAGGRCGAAAGRRGHACGCGRTGALRRLLRARERRVDRRYRAAARPRAHWQLRRPAPAQSAGAAGRAARGAGRPAPARHAGQAAGGRLLRQRHGRGGDRAARHQRDCAAARRDWRAARPRGAGARDRAAGRAGSGRTGVDRRVARCARQAPSSGVAVAVGAGPARSRRLLPRRCARPRSARRLSRLPDAAVRADGGPGRGGAPRCVGRHGVRGAAGAGVDEARRHARPQRALQPAYRRGAERRARRARLAGAAGRAVARYR